MTRPEGEQIPEGYSEKTHVDTDPAGGKTGSERVPRDPEWALWGPGIPDLDHANPKLREALKQWLLFLKEDVGFEGWRFDFVKGYGAEFVTEYVDETLPPKSFCVAEYWVDSK